MSTLVSIRDAGIKRGTTANVMTAAIAAGYLIPSPPMMAFKPTRRRITNEVPTTTAIG